MKILKFVTFLSSLFFLSPTAASRDIEAAIKEAKSVLAGQSDIQDVQEEMGKKSRCMRHMVTEK